MQLEKSDHLASERSRAYPMCPLGSVQAGVQVKFEGRRLPVGEPLQANVQLAGDHEAWRTQAPWRTAGAIRFRVQPAGKHFLRTFRSAIDDSIQVFGLKAPTDLTCS